MLLSITTSHQPATDLGFLLHKNPFRQQREELSFGTADVFYPEAGAARCTAVLSVNVDAIGIVRGRGGPSGEGGALEQYVNDRPYAASSFLSVAIGAVFRSALGGRCKERPELAAAAIPLEARLPVLPARGGDELLRRLFEPLGYRVEARRLPLDEKFPEWGESRYHDVTLAGTVRLQALLSHLYVLVPVLDDDKHYWVGDDEVAKLVRHGGDWLAAHPEKELIARRYLRHRRSLALDALAQLEEAPEDDLADDAATAGDEVVEVAASVKQRREDALESRISLNQQRMERIAAEIDEAGATTVMDLGCGEGRLLRALLGIRRLERVIGVDVSMRSLEIAQRRLKVDRMPPRQRERLALLHGSLTYRDSRLDGIEAATVVEVIEHLDPARLAAFERVLFAVTAPPLVLVTTPNVEFNVRFETLPAGQFRHPDHRFEWTRAEFEGWARGIAERHGYTVAFSGIGEADPALGSPTQMARFERVGAEVAT